MKKFIGFANQHGEFTNKDTGEVIVWSNRLIRCVTDEELPDGEYGLKTIEQKFRTADLVKSLGINADPDSGFYEANVDTELKKYLNRFIDFKTGLRKDKYEITGLIILPDPHNNPPKS